MIKLTDTQVQTWRVDPARVVGEVLVVYENVPLPTPSVVLLQKKIEVL